MEIIKAETIPGFNAADSEVQQEIKKALDEKLKKEIIRSIIHSDKVDLPRVNKALKTITDYTIKWGKEE